MIGVLFRERRKPEQFDPFLIPHVTSGSFFIFPNSILTFCCLSGRMCCTSCLHRQNLRYPEISLRQRAGFVKDHRLHVGDRLQIIGALDQNPHAGGGADPAEETERHGNHQGAGTGNNQKDTGAADPFGPRGVGKKRRYDSQQHRSDRDHRRVVTRKACDELLRLCFFVAGVFDKIENLCDRGILVFLCHADAQRPFAVDAAADHRIAGCNLPRYGFTGQRRGIKEGFSFDHLSVERHLFPGLDENQRTDRDILRVFLREGAVLLYDVCDLRRDLHQVFDRLSGFADGIRLKPFAGLVKEHDRKRLRILADRESGEGCDHHQKMFVEDLPAPDGFEGFEDDVITDQKIGNHKEHKKRPLRQGPRFELSRVLQQEQKREEGRGQQNAV